MEHPAHDRQRLAEPKQALGRPAPELVPIRPVLSLEPGAAHAQDRPTAGDVIDGGRHLCRQRRLAERVGADHHADPDPIGGLGPGGERQPTLEDRSFMGADDGIEVIPGPEGS